MKSFHKKAFVALGLVSLASASARGSLTALDSGPHHTVWRSILAITNGSHVRYTTNRYTELATGLNKALAGGSWSRATEELSLSNNTAQATGCQHSASLAHNDVK